jgi:hypothetical protein
MSRIFDNIDQDLLTTLRATMQVSDRSDFCVGYLNLRGWQAIDDLIAPWNPAAGQVCRVLVGIQRPPYEEIRELYRQSNESGLIDNATASRLKTQFAAHLREQITLGIPTGKDEAGLRHCRLFCLVQHPKAPLQSGADHARAGLPGLATKTGRGCIK